MRYVYLGFFFKSNSYVNMPIVFGDLFLFSVFVFFLFDELYITLQFDNKKRRNR